jgi:prenyltransferase beta subunit
MKEELLENQYKKLCSILKGELNSEGFWSGKLSSSALSTATSVVAFKIHDDQEDETRIASGISWLCENINSDGGFGDTPESESNVSTTLLCFAAIYYCMPDGSGKDEMLNTIESFLETKRIKIDSRDITSEILNFYGKDYTFSVPILSMLALCGVLGEESFSRIPRLPFELSLLPASMYRFFNLQVVSYAVPALIGVGIFIHTKRSNKFSPAIFYRNRCIDPAIKKLSSLLPESGGFLEAIPLTAFVVMCLIASNKTKNDVVSKGMMFLKKQQRNDGGWPIDTDLSTWVTTLAIKSLGADLKPVMGSNAVIGLKKHLLDIQYKEKHPFNGAGPGGWGWTSYSGSVPDADDTPGAILAMLEIYDGTDEETNAIINGCLWLEKLQNSDGGFPTFCKGWGRLPFDSSCADLTGHVILAILKTMGLLNGKISLPLQKRLNKVVLKAVDYLHKNQSENGSWIPLWFGNQLTGDKKNPVYGTAKVSIYLNDCLQVNSLPSELLIRIDSMISSSEQFLLSQQNTDGSWGGGKNISGTIEETSLAVSALSKNYREASLHGFEWLGNEFDKNGLISSPIGLYFAALWYDEKLYPLVYYIEALRRIQNINFTAV